MRRIRASPAVMAVTTLAVVACGAVGFTAYDGSGRQVAREVRPKDGQYYCSAGRHGFGFTLDASNVSGGIQWIKVQLWVKWPDPYPADRPGRTPRPRTTRPIQTQNLTTFVDQVSRSLSGRGRSGPR